MVKVTKQSVRNLTGSKRLPKKFRMYVGGTFLYDVLEANGLSEKKRLWSQVYWISCRSLNRTHLKINWKENL